MRKIRKRTIFIIEDEEAAAHTLQNFLEKIGYAVEISHNGEEALRILPSVRPDLVLLDIVLPEMNGVAILKEMQKAGSEFIDVPVLVMTNLPGDQESFKAMGLKVRGYFVKANTKLEELAGIIKGILGN